MADQFTNINNLATSLQSTIANQIEVLTNYRPDTFDISDPTAFVPTVVTFKEPGTPPSPPNIGLAPTMENVVIDTIGELTTIPPNEEIYTFAPVYPITPTPTPLNFPDAPTVAPLNLPSAVSPLAEFTGESPSIEIGQTPDAPVIITPGAPNLAEVNIPEPLSTATLPVWDVVIPWDDKVISTLPFDSNPLAALDMTPFKSRYYQSAELEAVSEALQADIAETRTGIPDDVEQSIWDRMAERDLIGVNDALKVIADKVATEGRFSLPPGKLDAQRMVLLTNYNNTKNDRNREISQKNSELTQNNRQFAITSALKLEEQQMQFSLQSANLLLAVAKETVNAGILIYGAALDQIRVRIDEYRVQAQVFETRLRAWGSQLEAQKLLLDAAKIQGDLNLQQLQSYQIQIQAQESIAKIYSLKVQAFIEVAKLEEIKLDVFRAQVEAYHAQVQGKVAEYQGYEAQVRAAAVVVEGSVEEIQAYKALVEGQTAISQSDIAKVDAYKALIQGEVAKAEVVKYQNDAVASQNKAIGMANEAAGMQIDAQGKRVSAQAEVAKVMIAKFEGELAAFKAGNDFNLEEYKAQIETFLTSLKLELARADVDKFNADSSLKYWSDYNQVVTNRANIQMAETHFENSMKLETVKMASELYNGILAAMQAVGVAIYKGTAGTPLS